MNAYKCDCCKQVFLLPRFESYIPMNIYLNDPTNMEDPFGARQTHLDICKSCAERVMNLIQMKNLASEMEFAHRDEGRIE